MDLLASLRLDSLPEHQTRTSRPSVSAALESNPNIRLGFDACCNCASPGASVKCGECGRVSYCSERCRAEDADPSGASEDEQAHGHSAVVCALIRLCDADEDVDERGEGADGAAEDRVRSEYESYPATLANVLMDGTCYRRAFSAERRRRGKRDWRGDRRDGKGAGGDEGGGGGGLTVHVIGASGGAELWGDRTDGADVYDAYAEALAELAGKYNLRTVRIIFVGPDCPDRKDGLAGAKRKVDVDEEGGSRTCRFLVEAHRSEYSSKYLTKGRGWQGGVIPPPDVVAFFNPGFTCPDYDWGGALSAVAPGTPFIVATGTEMEGVADCRYLLGRGYLSSLPPAVAEIVGSGANDGEGDGGGEDGDSGAVMFFGENPYAGSRVRQSGTMANDLFVKNRWVYGGVFSGGGEGASEGRPAASAVGGDGDGEEEPKKRRKGCGNTKRANPALV